jgi:hypothetical protein
MQEKIHMPPGFWYGIMNSTLCLTTIMTDKSASLGKDLMNIQTVLINI